MHNYLICEFELTVAISDREIQISERVFEYIDSSEEKLRTAIDKCVDIVFDAINKKALEPSDKSQGKRE